jgi:MoxR-like ATPase
MLQFEVHVQKIARVRLNESKARTQVNRLHEYMSKQFPAWDVELIYDHEPEKREADYVYNATLLFSREIEDESQRDHTRSSAIAICIQYAPLCEYWSCMDMLDEGESFNFEDWEVPELTDEVLNTYFGHIYEREPHIRIIHDSLKLASKTNFRTRHHILLRGKPACAKTILFLAFRDWLGPHCFMQISATSATKAGLEKELMTKAQTRTLPPILIVEEIEKTHPDNLNGLLQVMDTRGQIQKTNFFIGNQIAECPVLVWATCNDEALLRKFADGALWSRFEIKPKCERPGRELMERILLDECESIEGDPKWVEAIIKFLFEVGDRLEDHDDPRLAKALLVGGDRLLDGSFQKDYLAVNGL